MGRKATVSQTCKAVHIKHILEKYCFIHKGVPDMVCTSSVPARLAHKYCDGVATRFGSHILLIFKVCILGCRGKYSKYAYWDVEVNDLYLPVGRTSILGRTVLIWAQNFLEAMLRLQLLC